MIARLRVVVLAAAVLSLLMPAGAATASQASPLAPVHPAVHKLLSAKWWQWAASTPLSESGPFGQFGTDCGQNQPLRRVWFLAGQFSAEPAKRTCHVPEGTLLFIPIVNVECSSLEPEPFYGATASARRACVKNPLFAMVPDVAELDGKPIVRHISKLPEVTSHDFPIKAVAGNPAAIPAGRGFSVSRGFWLLLSPLSRGTHTLHIKGSIPAFPFTSEVTYHLTVGKPWRKAR